MASLSPDCLDCKMTFDWIAALTRRVWSGPWRKCMRKVDQLILHASRGRLVRPNRMARIALKSTFIVTSFRTAKEVR
jgi:hypothetical protein